MPTTMKALLKSEANVKARLAKGLPVDTTPAATTTLKSVPSAPKATSSKSGIAETPVKRAAAKLSTQLAGDAPAATATPVAVKKTAAPAKKTAAKSVDRRTNAVPTSVKESAPRGMRIDERVIHKTAKNGPGGGQIVSEETAKANPNTTYATKVKVAVPKKGTTKRVAKRATATATAKRASK